jgi:hypothetical protein
MIAKETNAIVAKRPAPRMKMNLSAFRRGQVLLHIELHTVGERLQQTERAGAVGAGTLLHPADDPPLEPDDDQGVEQQVDEEQQRLDQREPHGRVAEVGDSGCRLSTVGTASARVITRHLPSSP